LKKTHQKCIYQKCIYQKCIEKKKGRKRVTNQKRSKSFKKTNQYIFDKYKIDKLSLHLLIVNNIKEIRGLPYRPQIDVVNHPAAVATRFSTSINM